MKTRTSVILVIIVMAVMIIDMKLAKMKAQAEFAKNWEKAMKVRAKLQECQKLPAPEQQICIDQVYADAKSLK